MEGDVNIGKLFLSIRKMILISTFRYDECRLPPGPKCLHGGVCVDDVDGFECQCQDGFSGDHCQCSGGQDDTEDVEDEYQDMSNLTCIDVNTTLSWTIPPDYLPDLYDDHLYNDGDTTTEDAVGDRFHW